MMSANDSSELAVIPNGFVRIKVKSFHVAMSFSEQNGIPAVLTGHSGTTREENSQPETSYTKVHVWDVEVKTRLLKERRAPRKVRWGQSFDSHLYTGRIIEFKIYVTGEPGLAQSSTAGISDRMIASLRLSGASIYRRWNEDQVPTNQIVPLSFEAEASSPELTTGTFQIMVRFYEEEKPNGEVSQSIKTLPAKRRGAIKEQRALSMKEHKFIRTFFRQPAFCSFCSNFIWGLNKQGYRCQYCSCAVHKRCVERVIHKCTKSSAGNTMLLRDRGFKVNVPHALQPETFIRPKWCGHCGCMMIGRGYRCHANRCEVVCHAYCLEKIAPLCGVDQQLLSSALQELNWPPAELRPPSAVSSSAPAQIDDFDDEDLYCEYKQIGPPDDDEEYQAMWQLKSYPKYAFSDFLLRSFLGQGSFGKVFLAELKQDVVVRTRKSVRNGLAITKVDTSPDINAEPKYYAVKCLKKDQVLANDELEATMMERKVLSLGSQHPFLTQMISCFQNESHLFFVMEFLNGGDLMFHLMNKRRFSVELARFYCAEILSGLRFLHGRGIIYRDLKLENCVLDGDGHVRIADFGMCKEGIMNGRKTRTYCGTLDYLAPEIVRRQHYNESVDFWSFGVLLYIMLYGTQPFDARTDDEVNKKILEARPIYFREVNVGQAAISCIGGLLTLEPTQRLGMRQSNLGSLETHVFFKPIDFEQLKRKQIAPPFRPRVRSPGDSSNFDEEFTSEKPHLTMLDRNILRTLRPDGFVGFSFTNPEIFAGF